MKAIALIMLTRIPPKNKNFPRSAKRADKEKETNTTHVPVNADTII